MSRKLSFWAVIASVTLLVSNSPGVYSFFGNSGRPTYTLTEHFNQEPIAVFATRLRERVVKHKDTQTTVADLRIEKVLKGHGKIGNDRTIAVPGFGLPGRLEQPLLVVFLRPDGDGYFAVAGCSIASAKTTEDYLNRSIAASKKGRTAALRHYATFLNSKERSLESDACLEFARSAVKDRMEVGKTLSPSSIAARLQDAFDSHDRERLATYALLLGYCGKSEHAETLKKLIESDSREWVREETLTALVEIDRENWDYVDRLMQNPKRDFQLRYAALRAARSLWTNRTDLVSETRLAKSMTDLSLNPEMSDFAIDELRLRHRWESTNAVLELFDRKTHHFHAIKRAILRFALQSPEESAKAFVAQIRTRDAAWVADTEEVLRAELGVR